MKNYSYRILEVTDDKIVIQDDCFPNHRSLTNAAEDVVSEIYQGFGDIDIYYYDSDGRLDMMKHTRGVFEGFSPVPG